MQNFPHSKNLFLVFYLYSILGIFFILSLDAFNIIVSSIICSLFKTMLQRRYSLKFRINITHCLLDVFIMCIAIFPPENMFFMLYLLSQYMQYPIHSFTLAEHLGLSYDTSNFLTLLMQSIKIALLRKITYEEANVFLQELSLFLITGFILICFSHWCWGKINNYINLLTLIFSKFSDFIFFI